MDDELGFLDRVRVGFFSGFKPELELAFEFELRGTLNSNSTQLAKKKISSTRTQINKVEPKDPIKSKYFHTSKIINP